MAAITQTVNMDMNAAIFSRNFMGTVLNIGNSRYENPPEVVRALIKDSKSRTQYPTIYRRFFGFYQKSAPKSGRPYQFL